MEPITIFFLILAAVLLVLSCFLPEKKSEQNLGTEEEMIAKLAKRELTQEELVRIREAVDRIISEKTEEVIEKTDDYLSNVANEKIMAVDEFSKQIMERLGKDNSDATFLYKMISDAKEELKSEIEQARREKLALEKTLETVGKPEERTEEVPAPVRKKKSTATNTTKKQASETALVKETSSDTKRKLTAQNNANEKKLQTLVSAQKEAATESAIQDDIAELLDNFYGTEEKEHELPKNRILELHKKGLTVREISKELSMGQGEVKLVIELYGT